MRLVKLSVERFQCIESAEVEFGPGLNVLFGPNDLGKTSLAWAIRAVLLLQHGSSAHERFVSWHGGGDPIVTLTLTDDTDRYWRIKKVFASGASGRSLLESSKDGRTFTKEAEGRNVDEKIRGLLRWGVPAKLGGRGGPQGLPASFLTQVLLADQDDVRKILFDASLTNDPDESGRQRLTEALGALAQDPQFKSILDRAQMQVDRAYTANGRPRRTADSPFVEVAKRLEDLQQQRDDLRLKQKETELTEKELAAKNAERDLLVIELEQTRELSTTLSTSLQAQKRRDELAGELDTYVARLARGASLNEKLEQTRAARSKLEETLVESTTTQTRAHAKLQDLEAERTSRREALDRATRAVAELPTAEQRAQLDALRETLSSAIRREEAATADCAEAAALATAFDTQTSAMRGATKSVEECSAAFEIAREEEKRARLDLDAARDKYRETTSGEQARARELQSSELGKRAVELDAMEAGVTRQTERVGKCERLFAEMNLAQTALADELKSLATARADIATAERAIVEADREIEFAERILRYDDLSRLREQLAEARSAEAESQRLSGVAARLRAEAAALRANIPAGVPALATIDALQHLQGELRIGEAKLGAVTVQLRPARPLLVALERDGVRAATQEVREETVISAEGRVVVAIEGVGELEVSGGDDSVRATVARLGQRWQTEAVPVLRACDARNIEDALQLRRDVDRTSAMIDDRLRDAQSSEDLALRMRPQSLDRLQTEVTALEAGLVEDIDALSARHSKGGGSARSEAANLIERIKRERASIRTRQQALREIIVRHETESENHTGRIEALRADLSLEEAALEAPWEEMRDRTTAEHNRVRLEREEVERLVAALTSESGTDEAAAQQVVTAAEARLTKASSALSAVETAASQARENRATARAALDGSIERARRIDAGRGWVGLLDADAPVLDVHLWSSAVADATARVASVRVELAALDGEIEVQSHARQTSIADARHAFDDIERAITKERETVEQASNTERTTRPQCDQVTREEADLRVELASIDGDAVPARIDELKRQLADLPPTDSQASPSQLEQVEHRLRELITKGEDLDRAIERARGGLEKVGGAVVREQAHEIDVAIRAANEEQHQIEVEFEAWRLLVEALRASEASESQHLGRQLATPVSDRFRKLTGGRYGAIALDAQLSAEGLHVAGQLREIGALSAGTQDQLATLLRLCIAEHLKSSIVLDDHLSQSDPVRVAWFNSVLRSAATGVQIIVITCRPGELLFPDEVPAQGERSRIASGGLTHAIALEHSIRRFSTS